MQDKACIIISLYINYHTIKRKQRQQGEEKRKIIIIREPEAANPTILIADTNQIGRGSHHHLLRQRHFSATRGWLLSNQSSLFYQPSKTLAKAPSNFNLSLLMLPIRFKLLKDQFVSNIPQRPIRFLFASENYYQLIAILHF